MIKTTIAILVALLVLPATAAAQKLPACAPDKTYDVTLTSEEAGEDRPVVATHEVYVVADIGGDARAIVLTPQRISWWTWE